MDHYAELRRYRERNNQDNAQVFGLAYSAFIGKPITTAQYMKTKDDAREFEMTGVFPHYMLQFLRKERREQFELPL